MPVPSYSHCAIPHRRQLGHAAPQHSLGIVAISGQKKGDVEALPQLHAAKLTNS